MACSTQPLAIPASKIPLNSAGGMSFGEPSPDFHQWTIGPDDTRAVIKRALDTGINFIDTANCYSFGTSRKCHGAACTFVWGIARESVVLTSKVHFNEGGHFPPTPSNARSNSSSAGHRYLDLYIIHRFDYDVPMEGFMEALSDGARGQVRALGASAMYAYQLHNLQIVARDHGWTPFTSMQCHNLYCTERAGDDSGMPPVWHGPYAIQPHGVGHPLPPHVGKLEHTWHHRRPWPTSMTMTAPLTCPSLSAWPGCCRSRRANAADCAGVALGAWR